MSDFVQQYKTAMETDIMSRVGDFQGEMKGKAGRRGNSYILSMKKFSINPRINNNASKKFQKENENRSKIVKSNKTKKLAVDLQPIT